MIADEVKQMRSRGLSNDQIRDNLKARGVSSTQMAEAIQNNSEGEKNQEMVEPSINNQNDGEMEKSILIPQSNEAQFPVQKQKMQEYKPQYPSQQEYESTPPVNSPAGNTVVQEYTPDYQQPYQDYQPYQSYASPSSDLIAEISEQIVSEKLSGVRKAIEKSIDTKNTITTKVDYIEERLKRIEKIIDTLQSSILRKVGDYVNDVQDVRRELVETQKSLSKVHSKSRKHKKHKK